MLSRDKGPLCLSCAELDHLVFLPRGDAVLTRCARKNSKLSAVVLDWSRNRKRYERQGVLVESGALDRAEQECLSDAEARKRRQERETVRQNKLDRSYVEPFALRVRELFPGCPAGREKLIAEHACSKYGGRSGRSQAAKELDEQAVLLAVVEHIRHFETSYDEFLAKGWNRGEARDRVSIAVDHVMTQWKTRT